MEERIGSTGALSGIRVLDLTRVLAGPFCTMLMGDLGAEIIKIEVPIHGDDSRKYPPFIGTESAYFMNLNRNKKSIVLNLKKEKAKDILLQLVKKSDVLIENFRPGAMDSLGLSYSRVKECNPDIIYSSISGFGQFGPYKDLPGYDIIGQAMGGMMSVTGWPDGPPTRTGTAIADILGGLCSCIGILSSLLAVRNGKPGQKVDVALVDAVVSAMETIIQIYLVEGRVPQRTGNRYEFIYPYDTFKAKNGWVVIAVGNNKIWENFCKAIKKEDLITDFAYRNNYDRVKMHSSLREIVEEWTQTRSVKDIVDFLSHQKIPCAPILSVKEVVEDPHIAEARKMIRQINHPIAGKIKIVGTPIHLSETPPEIFSPAPKLGENTFEILRNVLDFSQEQILLLNKEEVIG